MTIPESVLRLALALAIGLLIGVERGWQERERKPGARAAGLRTYGLIGLLGGVWGSVGTVLGPVTLGFAALGFAGTFAVFEYRDVKATGSVSATGLVAALLAFALGAYAALGDMATAGAAAVAATVILAERDAMHGFLEKLSWTELRAALLLLVMTFVLLPILPNRTIDPWDTLNPYQLWLMAILIAALSYIGYVCVRLWGEQRGLLFAGAAGALVSSTTVTWTFAQMAKRAPSGQISTGILAAWTISLLRMTAIALFVAPALLIPLALPLGAAAAVMAGAAALFYRRAGAAGDGAKLALKDPFDVVAVLRFTALLALVLMAATVVSRTATGDIGLPALAFASGLVDVDPITLSTAKLGQSVGYSYAALVILIAAGANLIAKCSLAWMFGGARLAMPLIAIAALAGAGAAAAFGAGHAFMLPAPR